MYWYEREYILACSHNFRKGNDKANTVRFPKGCMYQLGLAEYSFKPIHNKAKCSDISEILVWPFTMMMLRFICTLMKENISGFRDFIFPLNWLRGISHVS